MTTVVTDPLVYDAALQVWTTDDPRMGETLLAHPSLRPPPYSDLYRALQDRFGFDFSAMIFAFESIPLCLHGAPHQEARRGAAGFLARRRQPVQAALPAIVETHLGRLRHAGELELMADVVEPLVLDVLRVTVDLPAIGFDGCPSTSRIFSRGSGLPRRRAMEAEVAELKRRIEAEAGADVGQDEIGRRLSLIILGRDALIGTIGRSLHDHFAAAAGRPLASRPFPAAPTATGVPYIERVATESVEIAGRQWSEGDRFRILFSGFSAGDDRERMKYFGVGGHTCLGRPVSIDLWTEIGAALATMATSVSILDFALRDDDVFSIPSKFHVRIEE